MFVLYFILEKDSNHYIGSKFLHHNHGNNKNDNVPFHIMSPVSGTGTVGLKPENSNLEISFGKLADVQTCDQIKVGFQLQDCGLDRQSLREETKELENTNISRRTGTDFLSTLNFTYPTSQNRPCEIYLHLCEIA